MVWRPVYVSLPFEQLYAHYLETCTIPSTILVDSVLSWHSRACIRPGPWIGAFWLKAPHQLDMYDIAIILGISPRTVVATDFDIYL
jgi:hypothetical protein